MNHSPTAKSYTDDWSNTSGARYLKHQLTQDGHDEDEQTKDKCMKTLKKYQRVETYSVYGGCEQTSRARPKSAIFMMSFVTSKFSA